MNYTIFIAAVKPWLFENISHPLSPTCPAASASPEEVPPDPCPPQWSSSSETMRAARFLQIPDGRFHGSVMALGAERR